VGVSATHLDWTMVPYVRSSFFKHYLVQYLKESDEFDKLNLMSLSCEELDDWVDENKQKYLEELGLEQKDFTLSNKEKLDEHLYQCALFDLRQELYQATEGLYHNLNSLQSRSGNQLPFTSINYGTCTEPEGQLVTRALLEGSLKGVGKFHKTPIFPCGIFQYMKGVNDKPGTPNYDLFRLALKSTSKRLYPNYANVDWSGNAGYDRNDPRTYFSTMGKRNTIAHLKPCEPC
jgi:ribonucleoside-triphosphate reductase